MKIIILILINLISFVCFSQNLPQKITENNQIIKHNGYILSYNEKYEQANWVKYVIKPSDFKGIKIKRVNRFRKDTLVTTGSASSLDYKKSGYDRGHLKPAGDEPMDSLQMIETFYMSNVSPQLPSFNRGIWRRLENYVRTEAIKSDSIIVITGGILTDNLKKIGKDNVSVPKYFYKYLTIYNNNNIKRLIFLIPNKKSKASLYTYRIKLIDLEKISGLKFY